ncbi:acyl-CoA dehydrogenase [Streptomyces sp. AJS327]|uniref:acyl-CoA dehydrogenase family protein n=1 Tax=Streptomyces sp. AJS327 TaxID=2545265 RepID=UPI0015DFDCFD|nr:acyl-CoA dehydrogenase family protein [Streptomyces sp. AJS327]MBA0050906.1 acyl-CoA dehydrogenase [Streptomyces sp. AJS327]
MTVSPAPDRDLAALVDDVLRGAEHPGEWRAGLDRPFWDRLAELGLTTLLSRQGAGWAETALVVAGAAARGVVLPVAEHDVLAGWLVSGTDAEEDLDGLLVPVVVDGTGRARAVPWAPQADNLVVLTTGEEPRVFVVPAAEVLVSESVDLAGRPCADIEVPLGQLSGTGESTGGRVREVPAPPGAHTALLRRRRLVRCVQITAAMGGALDLAIQYARERVQFGRPLTGFQAVQHLLADAAAEHALASAATAAALARADREVAADPMTLGRHITVASSVVARSLGVVSRDTHQVLGAMGTTVEHPLQAVLRPALAWRAELGDVVDLERSLAEEVIAHDGTVWDWITGSASRE